MINRDFDPEYSLNFKDSRVPSVNDIYNVLAEGPCVAREKNILKKMVEFFSL